MESLAEISEPPSLKYGVSSYTTSYEGESEDFITLFVRLRGILLHIRISISNFRNSPSMARDFYTYFEVARSGFDISDNDDLMYGLFDWATIPFKSCDTVRYTCLHNHPCHH